MYIKNLGCLPYLTSLKAMQDFTKRRNKDTLDELWIVEHKSVFTEGIRDSAKHLLCNPDNILLLKTDRGGQITYHGCGQIIIYCLVDIQRLKLSVKTFVHLIEKSIISLLAEYHITANRKEGMPGVYVNCGKIAALGLKIAAGCSYHGLSLNVAMDLTPFRYINPCGNKNLMATQMQDETHENLQLDIIAWQLAHLLKKTLCSKLLISKI